MPWAMTIFRCCNMMIGKKVNEDSEESTLARAFCSRNEVNTVIQEIGVRGGFNPCSLKQRIRFGD